MNMQYLLTLLEKYQAGTCTGEELQQVEEWYRALGLDRPDAILDPQSEAARLLTRQKLLELRAKLKEVPVVKISPFKHVMGWAAIFILAFTGGLTWYLLQQSEKQLTIAAVVTPEAVSRYLILPDSSRVLLHEGSKLSYPSKFTREVTLSGEAYFDIRQNSERSFVINTGKIRTTVLGTAFNIKAYPDQITISVTKGKVKVEEGEKVLAILTTDHQVVYNVLRASAEKQVVNAVAQAEWVSQDMVFESATMETIAATLSRRYHVNIQFKNEALKNCLVRASFTGMESLTEVLDVICMVRNASYTIENNQNVMIAGQPCQ